jgi:ABC-2 type transport system permease protein
MSTLTVSRPQQQPRSRPRPRFRSLVIAEWIKMWSLRSTYWVLGLGAVALIAIPVNSARNTVDMLNHAAAQPLLPPPPPIASTDRLPGVRHMAGISDAFLPPAFQILVLIAASIGAIAVFSEYSTGLVRTTFAAVPDRRAVVAAKITVVSAVTLAFGTVVATGSFFASQAILHTKHIGVPITAPGAERAVVASALLAPVCAAVGMAVAALLRHSAASVLTAIGVLLLLPRFFSGDRYEWVKATGNAMPWTGWDFLADPNSDPGKWPETAGESWTVFGAWFAVAALVTIIVVHRRDV